MKHFIRWTTLWTCLCLASCAVTPREGSWMVRAPASFEGTDNLDTDEFFEVVHSHVDYALYLLEKTSAKPITEGMVESFCGRQIKLKPGHSFYLVRAEFGNGATGIYTVGRDREGSLRVGHTCLGRVYTVTQSALVVMLKKAPPHVYTSLSVAL